MSVTFTVIEIEDGLTIATMQPGESAEDAAVRENGLVVDPGPFPSYEAANDALLALETDLDDEGL